MKIHTINSIKELYEWAKSKGVENYQIFGESEGITIPLVKEGLESDIDEKEKIVYL